LKTNQVEGKTAYQSAVSIPQS